MKRYLLLVVLLISGIGFCQNPFARIDQKMDKIPSDMEASTASVANYINRNFTKTEDKLRAAFYWTADHIDYDVANMDRLNYNQDSEEKIAYALKTRKGVCMHYAEVFKDIASKTGTEVLLIGGYTKTAGRIAQVSHQWCAAKIEGKWYLFDPTWGGGYVVNHKYVKSLSNKYYKAEPKSFIKSHMPFDYLWQFSEYPLTNQEFFDGKAESANKTSKFDFQAEIDRYNASSKADQHRVTAYRIEKNGLKSTLISERLEYEKTAAEHQKQKATYFKVKDIVDHYNKANALFNDFIYYRNNRFRPIVSDQEIKEKIAVPYQMLLECENDISQIKEVSSENKAHFKDLKKAISEAKSNYGSQLEFVNEYLSKNKVGREMMFYRKVKRG